MALADRAQIAELVGVLPGPVNIMARRGGLRVDELAALCVHRISLASGLHRLASERLRAAAEGFLSSGSIDDS
jgi:2-methylisocitrate lyase-like PEP mutase family enzyme